MQLGNQMQLEQSQKLHLSAELLQSIAVLQMNSTELKAYVEQELLTNPVLEEEDGHSNIGEDMHSEDVDRYESELYVSDERNAYDEYDFRKTRKTSSDVDSVYAAEAYLKREESLQEYLIAQLRSIKVSEEIYKIGEYIIYSLGDDGYLRLTMEELKEAFSSCDLSILEETIALIQSMEPSGICARSLSECLSLQLSRRGLLDETVKLVLDNHLEDIANNRIGRIASALKKPRKEIMKISDQIKQLEPKPGSRFFDNQAVSYIIPDVIVEMEGNRCRTMINQEGVPHIRINSYYESLMKENGDEDIKKYLTEKMGDARIIISNIKQRNDTLHKVVNSIIHHQDRFFSLDGNHMLRPMTMQEIADNVGYHVSTISRSVDDKYMQWKGKIYELKYFFGSGVKVFSDYESDTRALSANSVKELMQKMFDGEDVHKPLSDQKISELLVAEGIEISRRTVAKYRTSMGIPETSKRRKI